MLLAVDVGNTQTFLGLFDGAELREHWRLATDRERTGDELGVLIAGLLDPDDVDGICICSSVPKLLHAYELVAERWLRAPLLAVGPGVRTGIPIRYDDPREVGPDRIANAVGALERYGAPCIVVDFGTSTNFDVVSAEGEFAGGVLAPGDRDLDGRALRPRGAALHGRLRRAADGDRQDDRGEPAVGPRVRVRRSGRRDRRAASAASSAARCGRSRPAASPT